MITAAELSHKLNGRKQGAGYIACCPAHDDTNPSLSIDSFDGKILVHCFTGCTQDAVIDALEEKGIDILSTWKEYAGAFALVSQYVYQDDSGSDCLRVNRLENNCGGKKKFYQEHFHNGAWEKGGSESAPYRYSQWSQADEIILVEGEKCVEALEKIGFSASTTPGGAKSWKNRFVKYFRGKHVKIIPDNDKPGQEYAQRAFSDLKEVAESVALVQLPGLKEGEDIVEWLQAGNSRDDLLNLFKEISTAANDWGSPIPLDEFEIPELSRDMIPDQIADFAEALSKSTETPLELSLLLTLGMISISAAGKFKIETEPGFYEWTVLYLLCVLPPGNRKSAVLNKVKAPIENWERSAAQRLAPEVVQAQVQRRNQEAILKKLRNKLKGTQADASTIRQIEEIESNLVIVPKEPRLLATDITAERMATLMADHGEKMGLVSDEGGIFDTLAGRYSGGVPNLDLFLKSYDGSAARVDRQNGTTLKLKNPLITMSLCPQPSVLSALADKPEFRNRGLLPRFQFAVPRSPLGSRTGNVVPISYEIESAYKKMIYTILDFQPPINDDETQPVQLKLSADSFAAWKEFWRQTERKLGVDGEFELMTDWGAKFPGAIARIAALFHIAENHLSIGCKESQVVQLETTLKAIKLGEVLQAHARKAFQLLSFDPNFENARAILRWIDQGKTKRFTQRECHKRLQHRFQNVKVLRSALDILIDRNFIRRLEVEKNAWRPSDWFVVNPELKA